MDIRQEAYCPDRREFFKKVLLAGLALGLPPMVLGCSDDAGFEGSGLVPYKVWEEMLHFLKTSPDHLQGRMERLIRDADPEAMLRFVRDEIALIPAGNGKLGPGNAHLWGTEYALRSGMATLREKADLLMQLFEAAGIPSRVVYEQTEIGPEKAASYFLRPASLDFAPEIPEHVLDRWEEEVGAGTSLEELQTFEGVAQKAGDLGRRLWESLKLPEHYRFQSFDFRWDNFNTPTVQFEYGGKPQYACLFDPDVPFGSLYGGDKAKVREAKEPRVNDDKVFLKLTYRDSIDPEEEKELLKGEWFSRDLVGRQLDLLFLNNLTLEEQAVTSIQSVRTFTPALSLQAMDQSPEFMQERSILGNPITLEGQRIEMGEGWVGMGTHRLHITENPELLKKVERLETKIKTGIHPRASLEVKALDAEGNIVEGIGAKDFLLMEAAQPIRARMESNRQSPRILILADKSGSMPEAYSGAQLDAFTDRLRNRILEAYPDCQVTLWKTPSSLFTWLLKGSQTDNNLLIYITDGDNDDAYDPRNAAAYKSGPPAIVLNAKGSDFHLHRATFEKMAEVTGGVHLDGSDPGTALLEIRKVIDELEVNPYLFTFSLDSKALSGNITISMDQGRLKQEVPYLFESLEAPTSVGPAIVGLYLEYKYANQPPVKRTLAGWDYDLEPEIEPTPAMADAVNDLMLGGVQVLFEGSGPTFSAAMSDLLRARLSTRGWGEALMQNNITAAKTEFSKGSHWLSGEALALMAPLEEASREGFLTVPNGLRVGVATYSPGFITGSLVNRFDYLPVSRYRTLCLDPEAGFLENLTKTAQLAIRESLLFSFSTFSEMEDRMWVPVSELDQGDWLRGLPDKGLARYWRERVFRNAGLRIIDRSGQSGSFWNIDAAWGEVYGILPDMSGGGSSSIPNHIDKTRKMMAALKAIISIVKMTKRLRPMGATALGVVAQYGVTLVKLYAIASEAILIMDAAGIDEKIQEALRELACRTAKEIVFGLSGKAGLAMKGLDKLIGMMAGEEGAFGC